MSFFQIMLFLLAATAVAIVAGLVLRKPDRHDRNWKKAKAVYDKLNSIEESGAHGRDHGWLINYLRKIDPFVFEELILISLRTKGYRIRRNVRYTGDGGIDGRAKKNKQRYLIQCKRYSEYILNSHVLAFDILCRKKHRLGLFIHTGKTGAASWKSTEDSPVTIISGERLAELILKDKTQ